MSIIGEKILKLIYDMNFDSHPIIFHVFSNGGAYLYQHISYSIRNSNQPVQIRGMIFDSAPGDRRIMGLYRALRVILGKDKPCGHLRSAIVSVVLICLWIVEDSYRCFKRLFCPNMEIPGSNPLYTLMNEDTYYPQLFLYSKEDDIIPYYVRQPLVWTALPEFQIKTLNFSGCWKICQTSWRTWRTHS